MGLPWLQAPVQDACLRHRSHLKGWASSGTPERWYASPGAILPQQRSAGGASDITAPAELFQSALSALDLLDTTPHTHEQESGPQEDIAVEYGPTAASVGRAIYEVGRIYAYRRGPRRAKAQALGGMRQPAEQDDSPILSGTSMSRFTNEIQQVVAVAAFQVLRIDSAGRTRRIYVKRRDLLRANGLQPRDLRRIDPSQNLTKTSPNITVKENIMLINLGGVRCGPHARMHDPCMKGHRLCNFAGWHACGMRGCIGERRAIIRADKCLLFEPSSACSRKFLDIVCQRLQDHETARSMRGRKYHGALDIIFPQDEENPPPFELEILEAALMVATGALLSILPAR